MRKDALNPPVSNLVLSLAEWEYAHRYRDYLTLGDPIPDPAGFDPERIREIHRVLRADYHARRAAFFGRINNRVRGR